MGRAGRQHDGVQQRPDRFPADLRDGDDYCPVGLEGLAGLFVFRGCLEIKMNKEYDIWSFFKCFETYSVFCCI